MNNEDDSEGDYDEKNTEPDQLIEQLRTQLKVIEDEYNKVKNNNNLDDAEQAYYIADNAITEAIKITNTIKRNSNFISSEITKSINITRKNAGKIAGEIIHKKPTNIKEYLNYITIYKDDVSNILNAIENHISTQVNKNTEKTPLVKGDDYTKKSITTETGRLKSTIPPLDSDKGTPFVSHTEDYSKVTPTGLTGYLKNTRPPLDSDKGTPFVSHTEDYSKVKLLVNEINNIDTTVDNATDITKRAIDLAIKLFGNPDQGAKSIRDFELWRIVAYANIDIDDEIKNPDYINILKQHIYNILNRVNEIENLNGDYNVGENYDHENEVYSGADGSKSRLKEIIPQDLGLKEENQVDEFEKYNLDNLLNKRSEITGFQKNTVHEDIGSQVFKREKPPLVKEDDYTKKSITTETGRDKSTSQPLDNKQNLNLEVIKNILFN